jgi:hypothetical protein
MAPPTNDAPLISLLRAASRGRDCVGLASVDAAVIRWAITTGLGPLLYETIKDDRDAAGMPFCSELRSASLTAQVVAGEQSDAMDEILQACEPVASPITLLKGISISEQYYPEPHLRPMRDLDLLVEERALPGVESCLLKLGYCRPSTGPAERYQNHHHTMPLFHPQRRIWVEVHRGLLPPRSPAGMDKVFNIEHVKAQRLPSTFHGRAAMRLSDELQVVYIAAHWAGSFQVVGGMIALLDMIYLLQRKGDAIDWGCLLGWLPRSVASTYLYVVLTYLERHHLIDIDPGVLRELALCQRSRGSIKQVILHALIDRYYVGGSPFGWPFSPRNIRILWSTLLLPGSPLRHLLRLPCHLLLPWRLRKRFAR